MPQLFVKVVCGRRGRLFFGGRNRCGDFQVTKREIQEADVDYDKEMMMYI